MKKIFLLCLLSLGACSSLSLSKETCLGTDWNTLGKKDGREGRPAGQFKKIEESCSQVGIKIDREAYRKGYVQGIAAYCTKANGYYVGNQGQEYFQQCPPGLESDFLTGYSAGKKDHEQQELEKKKVNLLEKSLTSQPQFIQQKQCTFDSDCDIRRTCLSNNQCNGTNISCHFNSDCVIHGECRFDQCHF
jgi:hypothetical protein